MHRQEELQKVEAIIRQIIESGIPEEKLLSQLETFDHGIPYTRLDRPCTVNDGIRQVAADDISFLLEAWAEAAAAGRLMKFVPASGAASRMFKSLNTLAGLPDILDDAFLDAGVAAGDADCRLGRQFFDSIRNFAFVDDLKASVSRHGIDIEDLLARGRYRDILQFVLTAKGLNYSNLPKGLIRFHRYSKGSRTPFAEHLAEAVDYTLDRNRVCRIHFTVPPEHRQAIEQHLEEIRIRHELAGVMIMSSLSIQKPSAQTLAAGPGNDPFRTEDDLLVFRPAGHGALLENLNELDGDIVFIKNIDNVVPDHLRETTNLYKKILAGFLVHLQDELFAHLQSLARGELDQDLLDRIADFAGRQLSTDLPADFRQRPAGEQADILFSSLNRPVRVCGMVRNQGEPGGGPFWVKNNPCCPLQIVETAQIDPADRDQQQILGASTHFNPVDLVCGVRDFMGKPFDLMKYVDFNTGLITAKSLGGRELKAMELPGLWNGSMAYWNTVFIGVPLPTFNPVKTVNDLLRPEHQPPA